MSYDRRERIRQLLEKQGSVTIKELEQEFPMEQSGFDEMIHWLEQQYENDLKK